MEAASIEAAIGIEWVTNIASDDTRGIPTSVGADNDGRAERYAAGKSLRTRVPREIHAQWSPHTNRCDPVDLVIASSAGRIPSLVPLRYGRMSTSPFTFYRGTALNMAADLANSPNTGIRAQLCGDCHLMNFGAFATPERRVIFDINDFDETLPGPWEWDLKRLSASVDLAARSHGFSDAKQRDAVLACVRAYRERIAEYAAMRAVDVWYARIDLDALLACFSDAESQERLRKRVAKAEARTAADGDFPKMVERGGNGQVLIKDNPPLLVHDRFVNLLSGRDNILKAFAAYRESIPDDRRTLLDRYRPVDIALKVVGVGSVGTFCAVLLLMAEDDDPLFLQVKEAHPSVLGPYVGTNRYAHQGQRIVIGQRLMQSASDLFLGWTEGDVGRFFYVRQLRDVKLKPQVEVFNREAMVDYSALCGWTLARAHARSGDAAMIAGYLGKSDVFDHSIALFSKRYADQVERDHAKFMDAIQRGRIEAEFEH